MPVVPEEQTQTPAVTLAEEQEPGPRVELQPTTQQSPTDTDSPSSTVTEVF